MTARAYRLAHGLPLGVSLLAPDLSEAQSQRARARVGSATWERLEAARNPVAASHARTHESLRNAGKRSTSAAQARVNGRKRPRAEVRTCPVCGAQWCPLPPAGYKHVTCGADCFRLLVQISAVEAERPNAERDARIRAAVRSGSTADEQAAIYRVTPTRIRQIIRAGLRTGILDAPQARSVVKPKSR